MKNIFSPLLLLLIMEACNQNQKSTANQEKETEIIVGSETEVSSEEIEDLIVEVMINNRVTTSLAMLASEKAVNPRILSFGQMLIDHHDHFQANMIKIAQAYEIEPPSGLTPEAQETFDKLKDLPTNEFQKEFLIYTIRTHDESLDKFRKLMLSSSHPIERSILQNVQDTLQQHMEIAQNLQDEVIAGN